MRWGGLSSRAPSRWRSWVRRASGSPERTDLPLNGITSNRLPLAYWRPFPPTDRCKQDRAPSLRVACDHRTWQPVNRCGCWRVSTACRMSAFVGQHEQYDRQHELLLRSQRVHSNTLDCGCRDCNASEAS